MNSHKCSIIIAFYNKITFLKLVLAGYERQSETDFEIIIADDGSNEKVVGELQSIIQHSPLTIKHIWHEDKGWRKNEMLNKAFLASNSSYIIFTDGDCIPHKHFVYEHLKYQQHKYCLTGRRLNLGEKFTEKLSGPLVSSGYIERSISKLLFASLFWQGNHAEKGVYLKTKWLRKYLNRKNKGILGCNFSIYKEDLLTINGFDERYNGPGYGEDSDIELRLTLADIKIKNLNHIAVQYHLYHQELIRPENNRELFEQVQLDNIFYTPFGVNRR